MDRRRSNLKLNKMIDINGTQYPVRFSYKALKMFTQKTGLKLADLGNIGFEHIDILLFCGLQSGADFDRKLLKVTEEEVTTWLDNDLGLMSKVMDALEKDMAKLGEVKAPQKGAS